MATSGSVVHSPVARPDGCCLRVTESPLRLPRRDNARRVIQRSRCRAVASAPAQNRRTAWGEPPPRRHSAMRTAPGVQPAHGESVDTVLYRGPVGRLELYALRYGAEVEVRGTS